MEKQNVSVKELYLSFKGRISLETFWLYGIAILNGMTFLLVLLYELLNGLLFTRLGTYTSIIWAVICAVVLLGIELLLLFFHIKRCHDRNHSGWFMLILFIPIVGPIWYGIDICLLKGTEGENRFGAVQSRLDPEIVKKSFLCWFMPTPLSQGRKNNCFKIATTILLVAAISLCTIVIRYALMESSFDRYHEHRDNIYRIGVNMRFDRPMTSVVTPTPLAPMLRAEFPEVKKAIRLQRTRGPVTAPDNGTQFRENRFYYSDPDFFDIFTIRFIKGDKNTALADSNSVVITKSTAKDYFGADDPIGKTIVLNDSITYVITAVTEDMPGPSHFHFDFLARLRLSAKEAGNWNSFTYFTYVLVGDIPSKEDLADRILARMKEHMPIFRDANTTMFLQPLTDIHLHSHAGWELEPNGNPANIEIAWTAAILLFLLSGSMYLSLVITRIKDQHYESGDAGTSASVRSRLYKILRSEALLGIVIAVPAAMILSRILLPLNKMVLVYGLELSLLQTLMLSCLIGAAMYIFLLAAGYLLLVMFERRVLALLVKGILAVLQVALLYAFLTSVLQVSRQLTYMKHKDLGMDIRDVLVIGIRDWPVDTDSLKQNLLQNRDILSLCTVYNTFLEQYSTLFWTEGIPYQDTIYLNTMGVDYDFLSIFEPEIVAGRGFSEEFDSAGGGVFLINEAAARRMGTDVIGKKLARPGNPAQQGTIVGVVRDFNYNSLRQEIEPMLLFINKEKARYAMLKIRHGKVPTVINFVKEKAKRFSVDAPVEYYLLRDAFNSRYAMEEKLANLLWSALICMLILGGFIIYDLLSSFIYFFRGRDFPSPYIVHLLSGLLIIYYAYAISRPLFEQRVDEWIRTFAYRVKPNEVIYSFANFLILIVYVCITFLTFSYYELLKNRLKGKTV